MDSSSSFASSVSHDAYSQIESAMPALRRLKTPAPPPIMSGLSTSEMSTPRRSFDSSGSGGDESDTSLMHHERHKAKGRNRRRGIVFLCIVGILVVSVLGTLLGIYFGTEGAKKIPKRPLQPKFNYTGPDYTQYVKPMTGTEGGGNMFPGVTMPFGMVKIGIDMDPPGHKGPDAYSGYLPDGHVMGFSMMHESGTGGSPKYGVVSQLPVVGDIENPLADISSKRAKEDEAEVGLYTSYLVNGTTVKLTATRHAGAMQHTFAPDVTANVVVDVSRYLDSYRNMRFEQHYVNGRIRTGLDGSYRGHGTYDGGWNYAAPWTIYFCGRFLEEPESVKVFKGNGENLEFYDNRNWAEGRKFENEKGSAGTGRVGAVFTFKKSEEARTVESRIGISFISEERACEFMQDEAGLEHSFDQLVKEVKKEWNREVLSTITTTETNVERLDLLYTSLYGAFLIPSDRTNENPGWVSDEPYYDDIFTLWDLYRCHSPLNHLLLPDRYEGQIRSLIDIWRHDGYMPDGRSANFNGKVQGGSSSDNVLADAYIKGLRGDINWEDGWAAMVKNAEVQPPHNHDPVINDASTKDGRGALPDWLNLGYISTKYSRSGSRGVEYSLNDFALSQVAKGLGKYAEQEKYLERSRNWRNQWNPDANATVGNTTISGFIATRYADGTFVGPDKFNPLSCGGCYWGDDYYQGLPYEYSFGPLHDMETLISLSGGPETFTKRLELLFDESDGRRMLFNVGNEPSFASPYLFNFVGRQDLSAKISRGITKRFYHLGKNGIPGNSDAGAMQAFLLWNMLGLYPITATTTFLIASPWLPSVTIHPHTTNTATKPVTIETTGGEEEGAIYVQSVTLNGEPWDKNWLSWEDLFANGGTLSMVMGKEPKKWDTGALPPSYASGSERPREGRGGEDLLPQ